MKSSWHFSKQTPAHTNRDPIPGEYFATEAISNAAQALVREGIQNSLDARSDKGKSGQARVCITVSSEPNAASARAISEFMGDAWPHLHAPRNGLKHPPKDSEPCPFLVFEDFGTTGLQGDPEQWERSEKRNDFWAFFRAEGCSDKGGEDRGRWGVGKFVFARSSRINGTFGLTVRKDDNRQLLMGRTILKHHPVNGTPYVPDGYFGVPGKDGLVLPIEEADQIDRFRKVFQLSRTIEPGLSVVVPWYYQEEITEQSLLEAVIRDYFFPILSGILEVTVRGPGGGSTVTETTLVPILKEIGGAFEKEMRPVVELARWARMLKDDDYFVLTAHPANGAVKWETPGLIPDGLSEAMRERRLKGEPLAVRVPLTVRRKDGPDEPSRLEVFFVRDDRDDASRTTFVREGIIVSDVRSPRVRGIRSLVIVDDPPLATLLGDAENPAHTQWQASSSNFKDKYVYGPSYLNFVIKSVAAINRILSDAEKEEDPKLLLDLFSLPADDDEGETVNVDTSATGDGPEPKPPVPPKGGKPQVLRLAGAPGGFRVTRGSEAAPVPARIKVTVGYDVRSGNPLRGYDASDFDLGKAPIKVESAGLKIQKQTRNELEAEVQTADFSLTVTGFDERRDLYVKAIPSEVADADPED